MAKKISTRALAVPIIIAVALVLVVVLAVAMGGKGKGKKKAAPRASSAASARRAPASPKRSRAGAAAGMSADAADVPPAAPSSLIPTQDRVPHPEYLVSGMTANSEQPMPAAASIPATIARAQASDGPQDTKYVTTSQQGLFDGNGISGALLGPEKLQGLTNGHEVLRLFESNGVLQKMLEEQIELDRRPASNLAVNRAKPDREDAMELEAITIDMDVTQQSHHVGRSKRPSAVSPQRFANAVGPSNLAHLAASRSQYDSLITETLVEPKDREKIAALAALIQKHVTDPASRARLLLLVKPLISAVFKDEEAAQQALQNGGTGYIGFTDRIESRGNVGSLGARFPAGSGGDLMPLFGNYPPITTVNRKRLAACGTATTQAYEYAEGRDSGGFQ
jgi:hypothetical protein